MLQFLSRRWWGVTGWVYLLSLMLAAMSYWLLPPVSYSQRWILDGIATIKGFKTDHSIVVHDGINRERHARLDMNSSAVKWETLQARHDIPLLPSTFNVSYVLSYSRSSRPQAIAKLVLLNERNGEIRNIPITEPGVEVAYEYACHGFVRYVTEALATAGLVAMSQDERWLILLKSSPDSWLWLKNWMIEHTNWRPSYLPHGFCHSAIIVDLRSDTITTCDLSATNSPEFVIHPNCNGFAVVENDRDLFGTSELYEGGKTTISWYPLPSGPAYHTYRQWCLIAGAFAFPVLYSMLVTYIRKKRMPVSVPPHP